MIKSRKLFIALVLSFFIGTPVLAVIPNDPGVSQWAFTDIKAYEAWDSATGDHDVIAAIIDNGFDTFHPDLRDNVWKNEKEIEGNGIDDDNNGYVDDVWGWNFVDNNNNPRPDVSSLTDAEKKQGVFHHGTVVAGIIGASGNNGADIAGINWNIRLMNLKVIGNSGTGSFSELDDAIRYAVDNGADVINISMVGGKSNALVEAVDYAYEHGVAIIAAAGNDMQNLNDSPLYPICLDHGAGIEKVIGVSAIAEPHHIAQFSNIGSHCINITAPGVNITSTVRFSPTNGLVDRFLGNWQGTSFATPFVTGAAALIKSIRKNWGVKEIYEALLQNTHKTPPKDEVEYANLFGKGLLQIDKAVAYALSQGNTAEPVLPDPEKAEQAVPVVEIIAQKPVEEIPAVKKQGSSVFVFDPADGRILEQNVGTDEIRVKGPQVLQDAYSVASHVFQSQPMRFAVVRPAGNDLVEVFVFDDRWRTQFRWTASARGSVHILFGDVAGDSAPEVVLVPEYTTQTIARVFSEQGDLLSQIDLDASVSGVSPALVKRTDGPMYDILLWYGQAGSLVLDRVSGEGIRISSAPTPLLDSRGPIAAGDIDGDGSDEIILGSADGTIPMMAFMEQEGKGKRKFFAYDPSYISGFTLAVTDYNGDGKADVASVPKHNSQPVRVWSDRGERLLTWEAFPGTIKSFLQTVKQY